MTKTRRSHEERAMDAAAAQEKRMKAVVESLEAILGGASQAVQLARKEVEERVEAGKAKAREIATRAREMDALAAELGMERKPKKKTPPVVAATVQSA